MYRKFGSLNLIVAFVAGASLATCSLVLCAWLWPDSMLIWGIYANSPFRVEIYGHLPTAESEACSIATEWANHIEQMRHLPARPGGVENTRLSPVVNGGWHDVRSRLEVYQPSPELSFSLADNSRSVLATRGSVGIEAILIPDGPTCVRVSAGVELIAANCALMREAQPESWALCPDRLR
jgi:hypothetical protein